MHGLGLQLAMSAMLLKFQRIFVYIYIVVTACATAIVRYVASGCLHGEPEWTLVQVDRLICSMNVNTTIMIVKLVRIEPLFFMRSAKVILIKWILLTSRILKTSHMHIHMHASTHQTNPSCRTCNEKAMLAENCHQTVHDFQRMVNQ